VSVSRDCPSFWVPPIISGTGKLLSYERPILYALLGPIGSIGTKAYYKFRET